MPRNQNGLVFPDRSANRPGLDLNTENMFLVLAMVVPYVIVGFFTLLSLFNSDWKGVIYVIGVVMLTVVASLFFPTDPRTGIAKRCGIFNLFGNGRGFPFGVTIYAFTLSYLLFPMYTFDQINYQMIFLLLLLTALDALVRVKHSCDNPFMIFSSGVLGLLSGFFWYIFVYAVNHDMLYHTNFVSDKIACSMPSTQKFKCVVLRNGEVLT